MLRGEQREFEQAFQDRDWAHRYMQTAFVPEVVDGAVVGFYRLAAIDGARRAEHARDDALRLLRISMDNAPIGQAIADIRRGRNTSIRRSARCPAIPPTN